MSYAAALVLMLLSVLLLLAGFVSDSSAAFVMAAAASAGAIVLLAVRVKRRQPKTFVTDAPPQVRPAWLGAKRGANNESVVDVTDGESLPVELEIDHVIDGYRTLLASEILPMLETLSADELRKVVHVETTGRNREAIIQRANHLIDLIEGRRSTRSGAKRKAKTGVRSRLGVGRKAQAVIDPEAPEVPENAGVSVAEPEKPKPRKAAKSASKTAASKTAAKKSTAKKTTRKRLAASKVAADVVTDEAEPIVVEADEVVAKKATRKARAPRTSRKKTESVATEPLSDASETKAVDSTNE